MAILEEVEAEIFVLLAFNSLDFCSTATIFTVMNSLVTSFFISMYRVVKARVNARKSHTQAASPHLSPHAGCPREHVITGMVPGPVVDLAS